VAALLPQIGGQMISQRISPILLLLKLLVRGRNAPMKRLPLWIVREVKKRSRRTHNG
jgi:hypothetical protein